MFNEKLNEKFTLDFIDYCNNKSVLIVGNSLSLLGDTYGDLIDSYDVVVRLNKGETYREFQKFLGVKTSCWFFTALRADHYRTFINCPFNIFSFLQIHFYNNKRGFIDINKILLDTKFQIYRDYFLAGDFKETCRLIELINSPNRVSHGAFVTSYFINKIKSYKKLDLIGFDFFKKGVKFVYNNDEYVTNSFHLPLPNTPCKLDNNTPHHSECEEKYFKDLVYNKKIYIHPMDKYPSKDVLFQVFKKFRNKATPSQIFTKE